MKNPVDDNARKEELVRALAENLSVEQLGIALAFGRNLAMYGVDVTTAWKTATEQSAALEVAYHRGLNDGMLFSSRTLAASGDALSKVKLARERMEEFDKDCANHDDQTAYNAFHRGIKLCVGIIDTIIEEAEDN